MIIDAHVHVFDAMRGKIGSGSIQPLPGGKLRFGNGQVIPFFPPIASRIQFTPEMLLESMDQAGVDRAVLLQGPFYGDMNEYVLQAVRRWPTRLTGAAYLDLWSEHPQEDFHRVVDPMGFRIVKLELSEATGLAGLHPSLRLDDPRLDWFWNEANRRALVVTLDLGPIGGKAYQTEAVAKISSSCPSAKIVIAHLCQPPLQKLGDETSENLWQEQVRLARQPNVWLDLASLPNYAAAAREDYPYPSALRYLRQAIRLVGSDKILWGSDIPGTLLHNTYPQLMGFFAHHNFLSPTDLARILGQNAMTVYG